MALGLGVLIALVASALAAVPLKRTFAPSVAAEESFGNMRNLMEVGKRQLSMAGDTNAQWQNYARLYDIGKKRSYYSPSEELGIYSQLYEVGKKRSAAFAPSQEFQTDIYNRLFEVGKRSAPETESHDAEKRMNLAPSQELGMYSTLYDIGK
ncbi:unnamed protein product, partial [Mesorhabditis spiculigera]